MELLEKKQKSRDDLKNNILQIAISLVENDGWNALSMRKIANQIDYSVPVIYEYFDSKEVLLDELRQKGFEILNKYLRKSIETEKAPQKMITNLAKSYWNFAMEFPSYYQLMFNYDFIQIDRKDGVAENNVTISIFKDAIHWLAPNSRYDEELSMELVDYLLALLHGMITLANNKSIFDKNFEFNKLKKATERFIRSVSSY
ncbi:MAG: TetR/AcrR family transcriptional regulator [Saprospiraceae bacterium]|jgi:AcrR family transcriptional regulator|nr:TetR/AcrR family transcriptional regulator [Saprospiraceae bacterium]